MSATIPFIATIALAVMSSITAMHYTQINKMVEHDALVSNVPPSMQASGVFQVSAAVSKDAIAKSPVAIVARALPQTGSRAVAGNYENKHEGALLEILAEMRREQKSMRLQIAETNRDLAEANFRLDATSNDFRPLRTDSERPRAMDDSSDPLGGNMGIGESLLPLKPN